MDFSFSEDAEMVRQTAHEFVRRDLLPKEPSYLNSKDDAARRQIADTATDSLKEMGLYSAGVPEQFGGGGLGLLESCLVVEELSRTIIPVEWGELTPILYECSDAQKADYLTPVVEGRKRYAIAFDEPPDTVLDYARATPADSPFYLNLLSVSPFDGGYVLLGNKLLSRPDFDFFLAFARAPEGPTCFIVDHRGRNERRLTLENLQVRPDKVLGAPGKALSLGRKWFPHSRIQRAAAILGACDRLLEVNAQYAHDWNSLGRPIHERTSVQRIIADMAGDIEALRWLIYRAAWLAAEAKKVEYDSMLVKLQAQRVLTDTVNRSVRIHGGTMPAIAEWLAKSARDTDSADLLRLAVARETISRLLP